MTSPLPKVLPESTFTGPRTECPEPQLWSAYDTDSSELEVGVFVAALVILLKPSFVLETGSCFGFTTAMIGDALRLNGRGHCVSLEADPERARLAEERTQGLPVTVLPVSSLDYRPPERVDLAFIDSDMSVRIQEWQRFLPHFAVFHDSGMHKELRAELYKLESRGDLQAVFFPTPRGLCLMRWEGWDDE